MTAMNLQKRLSAVEAVTRTESDKGYIIPLYTFDSRVQLTRAQGIKQYCKAHSEDQEDIESALESDNRYVIFLNLID